VATSRLHTLEEIGDIDEEITLRPRVGISHSRLTDITSPALKVGLINSAWFVG
jgi:hypothetical protein